MKDMILSVGNEREKGSPYWKYLCTPLLFLSNRSMDVKLTDGKSELRLLSRKAINAFVSMPEYNRFNKGLYEWIGFKEKVIPYKMKTCKAGKVSLVLRNH